MKVRKLSSFHITLKTLLVLVLLVCAFLIGLGFGASFLSSPKNPVDSAPVVIIDFEKDAQIPLSPLEQVLQKEPDK